MVLGIAPHVSQPAPNIQQLVSLAHDRSTEARNRLYTQITDIFAAGDAEIVPTEARLMCDILRRLTHDVEKALRARVAERLATKSDMPRDLAVLMANDEIEIAFPVITRSPLLTDQNLIDIVRQRGVQHQIATASREALSETVSAELVSTGNEDVIVTLLNNNSARIAEATLAFIADEAKRVDAYQKPLVRRTDLPESVRKSLLSWVSDSLKTYIAGNFEVDAETLQETLEEAVSDLDDYDARQQKKQVSAEDLVEKLNGRNELNAQFVLKSLRQGQVALFEAGFAKLLGVNISSLLRRIYNEDPTSLAVACRAMQLDWNGFKTVFGLSRRAKSIPMSLQAQQIKELRQFYERLSHRDALNRMASW